MALKVYSETKEPYLQLAAPFEHIRITAPRLSDVPLMAKMLNSHSVWPFLSAPTYPYSEEAVRETISARQLPSCEKAWSEIRDKVIAGDKDYVARSMPVMSVREVLEDGSEVYRGDAWVNRSWYHEVEDLDERRKAEEDNLAKEAGDPTIMWALAFRLDPSVHGRGLMTAIMRFIIYEWAVPHLGARHFVSVAFWDNIGSQKVALKVGLKFVGISRLPGDLTETHDGRTDNRLFVYKLDI